MTIYVDVDGTISRRQSRRSLYRGELRQDVVAAVLAAHRAGHSIVIWTRDMQHARTAAYKLGIESVVTCLAKPDLIVDNQPARWRRLLGRRVITPEEFIARSAEIGKR